jgi:acetyltransferase-like isoleucine patch superfamily enzyme
MQLSAILLARACGLWYRLRHAASPRVRIGAGLLAEGPRALRIEGPGRVEIGAGTKLRRSNGFPVSIRTLSPSSRVRIGAGSELGGVEILCSGEVSLGERTLAANCRIQDVDFAEPRLDTEPRPIRLGTGVWLGLCSLVLKQAELGDWSIVAAGSVVDRRVAGRALAVGNPARPIPGVVT